MLSRPQALDVAFIRKRAARSGLVIVNGFCLAGRASALVGDDPDGGGQYDFCVSLASAWENHAAEWISWARTSRHDGFWDGTWPELVAVPPPPSGVTVEVGCGEGRVSRHLLAAGHSVVAVEQSLTLAHAACSGDPTVAVARADAAALPLASGCASLVVACMALQDVDDLVGSIAEISRILCPSGVLCFSIVHPFSSAQDQESLDAEGAVVITRPYLEARRYTARVDREGLGMTFASAHWPLSVYVTALANAGLALDAMREFGRRPVPWLLTCRATKVGEV